MLIPERRNSAAAATASVGGHGRRAGVGLERQVCPRRAELRGGVGAQLRLWQRLLWAARAVLPPNNVLTAGEHLLHAGGEPVALESGLNRLVRLLPFVGLVDHRSKTFGNTSLP